MFRWTDGPITVKEGWTPWNDQDDTMITGEGPCFVMDLSRDKWTSVQCSSFEAFMCKKRAGKLLGSDYNHSRENRRKIYVEKILI